MTTVFASRQGAEGCDLNLFTVRVSHIAIVDGFDPNQQQEDIQIHSNSIWYCSLKEFLCITVKINIYYPVFLFRYLYTNEFSE